MYCKSSQRPVTRECIDPSRRSHHYYFPKTIKFLIVFQVFIFTPTGKCRPYSSSKNHHFAAEGNSCRDSHQVKMHSKKMTMEYLDPVGNIYRPVSIRMVS